MTWRGEKRGKFSWKIVAYVVVKPPPPIIMMGQLETSSNNYLLTYNLASLSGPNSARARAQLTLCLMKQFRSNCLTLY
jgi:hypothetical protein